MRADDACFVPSLAASAPRGVAIKPMSSRLSTLEESEEIDETHTKCICVFVCLLCWCFVEDKCKKQDKIKVPR